MRMSDDEIKRIAWERLFRDKWFWRLFGGEMAVQMTAQAIAVIVAGIFAKVASRCLIVETLLGFILCGIVSFGGSMLLLKCLKNESENWLPSAFEGFKYPLGLFWLGICQVFIYLCWALLFFIPFIFLVPFYRYRFLWLVKAEHPDWSAIECIKATRKLMDGNKMRSFNLDLAYWKPITGILLLILATMIGMALLPDAEPIFVVVLLIAAGCGVVLGKYVTLGQAVLYRELKDENLL